MKYTCDNCGKVFPEEECKPALKISERIDPGGKWTDKECPDCGSLMYKLPGMRLRLKRDVAHTRLTVFAGDDIEHLACCGMLVMRHEEAVRFVAALYQGADSNAYQFELEEEQA